jgi:hypothetical protein
LIYANIFALRKKDCFKFKSHGTIFLDVSELLKEQSSHLCDIIVNAWVNYVYNHVSQNRKEASNLYSDDEDYFKRQWQGMVVFDEFYELTRNYDFNRLMKTVQKIGTQGRQEGTSLVLATQTIAYGGKKEKIPMSQASHIFQFKSSYASDKNFVMRTMGWEDSQYKNQVYEIFDRIFPYSKEKNIHKGKIILFSKDSNTISSVRLKMLS